MINLIHADLYGLRKSKTIRLLFCLMCLCVAGMAVFSHMMSVEKLSADLFGLASFFTDYQMIPLTGTIIASSFICGDFENKTIHDAIACGSSRKAVLLSKTISFSLILMIMMLPYIVCALVSFIWDMSFVSFLPSIFLHLMALEKVTLNAGFFLKLLAAFFTTMVVYIAQMSICVLTAFSFRKTIAVIGLGYGLNFLLGQLAAIDKLHTVLSYTPYGTDFIALVQNPRLSHYLKPLISSLIFMALIISVSYLVFRRSEIK